MLAERREDEIRCATQSPKCSSRTEDVTARVAEAVRGLDERAAKERRRQTLTNLEQSCEKAEPLQCEAVTLYGGGQYWLYKYRRYTGRAARVITPRTPSAAFGGDPDNFQFPRMGPRHGPAARVRRDRPAERRTTSRSTSPALRRASPCSSRVTRARPTASSPSRS
jgi:hypothetical protein